MGKYRVRIEAAAAEDLIKIRKSGRKSDITKIERIFLELAQHPETGVGKPERLKHDLAGLWSRRINDKDRLVYEIIESEVIVSVFSLPLGTITISDLALFTYGGFPYTNPYCIAVFGSILNFFSLKLPFIK